MNPVLRHPAAIADGLIETARIEQLREALEILADMTGHADAAVIAAARTVLTLTRNEEHFQEAFKALRLLDQLEQIP